MQTVYVDSEFKCHLTDDGTMTAVEDEFFNGKCQTFVEGFVCDDSKGYRQIYPWKDYGELDNAQREYEKQLLADLQENSILISDLEVAYQEGVNSAYG